ncbi:DNA polymerase III subunit delta [Aquifex pyrophilus]
MERNIIQFQKEFLGGKVKERVFILHGDEPYLIRTFLSKLKERFGSNYRVLWGDEITEEELYSALSERGIFGSSKEEAVVLYKFESFLKKLGRKKKSREFLIKTLKGVKSNYLFIVFDRKLQKQELSTEPYKSIQTFGLIVNSGKLSKEKIKNLVRKKFTEKGIKIEEEALNYLLESAEYNLMELKLEVEKLIDYAWDKKSLSLEDIKRALFTLSDNINVFNFVDVFLLGDYEKAVETLENLYRWGIHPLQIQKLLTSYVIKLYTASRMLEKEDKNKVLEKLGIKNQFAKLKFTEYLKRNDKESLKRMLTSLQRIDMLEKLYFQDPSKLLKEFVLSFALSPKKV